MLVVGAVAWVIIPSIQELQLASSPSQKSLHWFSSSGKRACEQAHLWVSRMSGKVWVSERGVWCRNWISLPWSLFSLVPRVFLSLFPRRQKWERGRSWEIGWLPYCSHVCCACSRSRKENCLCLSNFSFGGIISLPFRLFLKSFGLNRKY